MFEKQPGAFTCFLIVSLIGSIAILFNSVFLAAALAAVLFLLMIYSIFIEELDKSKESKEDELVPYASSNDAVNHKDKLNYEFEKLVAEIAHYKARSNAKLRLIKDGESKERLLISSEDMDAAFLEAIKELYLPPVDSRRATWDSLSLLEKIREIRKLYEPKTP